MYKILLKCKGSAKEMYFPYKVKNTDISTDTESSSDYETDSLEELAETIKELMNDYPLSEIKAIQELDTEVIVEVIDNLP